MTLDSINMPPRSAGWGVVSTALALRGNLKAGVHKSQHEASQEASSPGDVYVSVMGVTGAGKSSFIKRVTQREDIAIGHGLTSETVKCQPYRFTQDGTNFTIVDTPGFNDTFLDEATILSELANFMEHTYRENVKLTAVIYLHPITNDRFEGSARDNFYMFKKLCGPNFYSNVVLATNFWSLVDEEVGKRRQSQLEENDDFWGAMKRKGSEVIRLPDERQPCIDLLMQLAGKEKVALKIQEELVDQQLPISRTEAASTSKNLVALQQLHADFEQQLAQLQEERTALMLKNQAEIERIQKQHQEVLEAEMRKHEEQMSKVREASVTNVREIEERQTKRLEQQRELLERTKSDAEKVRNELENLTVQETNEQARRDVVRKQQDAEAAALARKARVASQLGLFNSASAAGTIKAKIAMSFEEVARPYCDRCLFRCDAQLAYSKHAPNYLMKKCGRRLINAL